MSRVFAILWFLVALLLPELARAQGVGGFVSPGPLAQPHAEFDTLPDRLREVPLAQSARRLARRSAPPATSR